MKRVGAAPLTAYVDHQPRSQPHYARNILLCALLFSGAFVLAYFPNAFDLPVERWINSYSDRSAALNLLFFDLDSYFSFTGVLAASLISYCWFSTPDIETRTRLLTGTLSSIAAGTISRFAQHALPSHPRPYYDPALGFNPPATMGQTPLNTWDSFPSDHAAVLFSLAAVVWVGRPRLGIAAFAWIAFAETARAYMGGHYPSDIIGGAALGSFFVWLAQEDRVLARCRRVAAWSRSAPGIFYMCAFFLMYQIATLFADVRFMSGGVLHELERFFSR